MPIPSPAPLLRRFLRARSGNIATIFALAAVPLVAFAGAAVDYGLATRLQVKLQAANDATALALCQTPNSTTAAVMQLQAQTTMAGYVPAGNNLSVDPVSLTTNPRKVLLTSHAGVLTFFSGVIGKKTLTVSATSQCGTPMPKTFEIALVLDNTGSMAESSGGQTKIQAVQTAATNFVNYVNTNPAFASDSRISIVPFAAAVKVDPTLYATAPWVDTLGQSSYHWTNVDHGSATNAGFKSRLDIFNALKLVNSGWGWGGCFDTLPYPLDVQDGAPTSNNKDSYYVPFFAPDEPGSGTTSYSTFQVTNPNTRVTTNYYSTNSYINDTNGVLGCPTPPTSSTNPTATFNTAENQACKYVAAKGAQPTSSGYAGLPNGPNFQCVSQPLQRLTSNTTVLKTLISSLTAAGSTNIHDGVMWGWRTLSPNSVFADGAAYGTSTVNKIMVVMTDGTNTWSPLWGYNPNGTMYFPSGYLTNADGSNPSSRLPPGQAYATDTDQRNAIDALTKLACTNAKAAGISVYTIGFSIPSDPIDAQGLSLLQSCASSQSQSFVANDSTGLIAAFNQIATSIGSLRLTE